MNWALMIVCFVYERSERSDWTCSLQLSCAKRDDELGKLIISSTKTDVRVNGVAVYVRLCTI